VLHEASPLIGLLTTSKQKKIYKNSETCLSVSVSSWTENCEQNNKVVSTGWCKSQHTSHRTQQTYIKAEGGLLTM
jgi:hypothetical protein